MIKRPLQKGLKQFDRATERLAKTYQRSHSKDSTKPHNAFQFKYWSNRKHDDELSHKTRQVDIDIVYLVLFLLSLGLIMVYSASINVKEYANMAHIHPMNFLFKQAFFTVIGLLGALFTFQIPIKRWEHLATPLFLVSLILLLIVLIPSIGKLVNNSRRWIPIGIFTFQPSELMKWAIIPYAATYCIKKQSLLHDLKKGYIYNFIHGISPMFIVIAFLAFALMFQPDLGALVIIAGVALGILFLGGSSLKPLFFTLGICVVVGVLIILYSKRVRRILAFLDPWSPEFIKHEGFQLTNSLIAFGRGEFFGVGLGNSIEKLSHLTEAHTDFIFAIIAEELGFVGIMSISLCYIIVIHKAFRLGRLAHQHNKFFDGLLAQGIGMWFGLQTGIHICVNSGALPTKGLTLPFISYGGSALIISIMTMGVLLRIDYELRRDIKLSVPFELKII